MEYQNSEGTEAGPEQRFKIGLVSVWPTETFGTKPAPGLARYTHGLSQIMASKGHEIVVIANEEANAKFDPTLEHVAVRPAWRANDARVGRSIKSHLRAAGVDIVHVQHELFLYGSYASAFLFPYWLNALAAEMPTVVTVHGVLDPRQVDADTIKGRLPGIAVRAAQWGLRHIFQRIAESRAHKVVHSDALRARLLEYGGDPALVSVAPHPLLSPSESAVSNKREARASLGIPSDSHVVLTWGFDNSYKGFDVLAEGFAEFYRRNGNNATLIMGVGPHPKMSTSETYVAEYNARTSALASMPGVRFVGFIPDESVSLYIAASDVAVFPYTKYVAASGPLSTALASGLPVLLSNVFAGVPTGIQFQPEPLAIAAKLQEFFANTEAFAAASRNLALESSDDEVAKRYLSAYSAALAI